MHASFNRRTFVGLAGASIVMPQLLTRAISAQGSLADVVTIDEAIELAPGIVVNHFRVVGLAPVLPDQSSIIGSITNTGTDPVDAPYGIDVVTRDAGGVITGSGYLDTDYPVLPPGEPMGFGTFLLDIPFSEIDPAKTTFDTEGILTTWQTGAVERIREHSIEVIKTTEISRSGSLAVECEIKNTSSVDFENGIDPRISVWDSDGFYSGNAFDNVFQRIPAGETIRFETQSRGSIPNPVEIADPAFTWKAWFDPR